jgi:hypothetical protein
MRMIVVSGFSRDMPLCDRWLLAEARETDVQVHTIGKNENVDRGGSIR